ncbi:MAG TPA: HEAT repeat domain-containing protein, partial [Pseudomonadota bacterium]|nr:HEAT repeat domain-containing protein [Pseudomonadota bacterium]
PDNVFLLSHDADSDFVKIVDFGIAKSVAGSESQVVRIQAQVRPEDAFAATVAQSFVNPHGPTQLAPEVAPSTDALAATADQPAVMAPGPAQPARQMAQPPGDLATADQPAVMAPGSTQTAVGTVVGTPPYMSPEQCRAAPVDSRTDQYAVGCMLYEMLTGQLVFPDPSAYKMMQKHCDQPPQSLRERAPQLSIPEALDAVVLRMLAKDSRERFASMTEVSQVLGQVADQLRGESIEKVTAPTGVVGLLGANVQGAQLLVRGHKVSLRAVRVTLLSILIVMTCSVGFLGYRLYQAQTPPKTTLEPGELQRVKAQALAVLRSAATSTGIERQRRLDAIAALGQTRDAALRPLLEGLLGDAQEEVQAAAAAALGRLGDRAASGTLQTTLQKAAGSRLRLAAARALLELGQGSGEEVLARALAAGPPEERLRAASLLCDRRNRAAEKLLLQVVDQRLLKEESAILGALGCLLTSQSADAARERLHSRLKSALSPEQQIDIGTVLARTGDLEGRRVLRELASQSGIFQLPAARALAAPDVPEVADLFRRVLDDRQAADAARQLASEGLGQSGQLLDVRLLARSLSDAVTPELREIAAVAVLRLGAADPTALGSESLRWARGSLGSDNWQLRESAALVLGDSSSPEAVNLLTGMLKDGDARVRRGSVRALGRRLEEGALLALRGALRDPDPEVRLETLRSVKRVSQLLATRQGGSVLGQLGGWLGELLRSGLPKEQILIRTTLLQLGDTSQKQGLRELQSSPDPAVRRFLIEQAPAEAGLAAAMLGDADAGVRFAAARQLAEAGDARAVGVLKQTIAQGGADSIAAYGLMSKLGQQVAEPATLHNALQPGSPVLERMAAVEAMAAMPAALAVPLLLKAARDPEPLVRRLCAEIAADIPETAQGIAGIPVLRWLLGDLDLVVRNRAAALLSRLTAKSAPPEESSSTATRVADAPVAPSAASGAAAGDAQANTLAAAHEDSEEEPEPGTAAKGTLALDVPEGVLFRIDKGKWQTATGKGISLPSGPHQVATLASEYEVQIEPEKKVHLKLSASPVDELVQSGSRAYEQKEFTKAQKQYDRASALCGRDRDRTHKKACAALELALAVERGLIFEQQRRFSEAMAEYQKAVESARGKARVQAAEAISRLAPQLGKVILRSTVRGKCRERIQWVLPGKKQKIKVGSQSQAINLRAGQAVEIGQCP